MKLEDYLEDSSSYKELKAVALSSFLPDFIQNQLKIKKLEVEDILNIYEIIIELEERCRSLELLRAKTEKKYQNHEKMFDKIRPTINFWLYENVATYSYWKDNRNNLEKN